MCLSGALLRNSSQVNWYWTKCSGRIEYQNINRSKHDKLYYVRRNILNVAARRTYEATFLATGSALYPFWAPSLPTTISASWSSYSWTGAGRWRAEKSPGSGRQHVRALVVTSKDNEPSVGVSRCFVLNSPSPFSEAKIICLYTQVFRNMKL